MYTVDSKANIYIAEWGLLWTFPADLLFVHFCSSLTKKKNSNNGNLRYFSLKIVKRTELSRQLETTFYIYVYLNKYFTYQKSNITLPESVQMKYQI